MPLLIGILLFFLISPVVDELERRGVSRWISYLLLCLIAAAALTGFGWLVAIQGDELRTRLPDYRKRAQRALDRYGQLVGMANQDGHFDTSVHRLDEILPVSQDDMVNYVLRATVELLELTTMAIFYLLFALVESKRMSERFERYVSEESATRLDHMVDSIKIKMRRYLQVKTAISAGMGLTTAALGWGFRLDFWLLWGLLMFLANYITYIGSIAALFPPVLIAFVQFDSLVTASILTALLIASRLVWVDYVEMQYSGKHVDVSPLLVLLSVALFGWMWGVVGMLLSVPLLTSAHVVLSSYPDTKLVAKLMSDRAAKPSP